MDLLARRDHSRLELRRKLLAHGVSEPVVECVLDEIEAQGLQSDVRFVENYVYHRVRRGYGPLRILEELKVRGIEDSLAKQYIDSSATEWEERIMQVRAKRFGARLPHDFRERARQSRFLEYRGFTSDQIRRLMHPGGE
jgi:regulatory protein